MPKKTRKNKIAGFNRQFSRQDTAPAYHDNSHHVKLQPALKDITITHFDDNNFELQKTIKDNKKWKYNCKDLTNIVQDKNSSYKACKADCYDGNNKCHNVKNTLDVSARFKNNDISLSHQLEKNPEYSRGIKWDCACGKPKKSFFSRKKKRKCKCKNEKYMFSKKQSQDWKKKEEDKTIEKRIDYLIKKMQSQKS